MEAARQPSRTEKESEGGLQSSREGSGIGHGARYKRRKFIAYKRTPRHLGRDTRTQVTLRIRTVYLRRRIATSLEA
jgi:hypothetical protein